MYIYILLIQCAPVWLHSSWSRYCFGKSGNWPNRSFKKSPRQHCVYKILPENWASTFIALGTLLSKVLMIASVVSYQTATATMNVHRFNTKWVIIVCKGSQFIQWPFLDPIKMLCHLTIILLDNNLVQPILQLYFSEKEIKLLSLYVLRGT